MECPVAHGEGNFQAVSASIIKEMSAHDQIALVYVHPDGSRVNGHYPENPNGSVQDIAGICNLQGNILGLMPHPENHIHPYQHPQWTRNLNHTSALPLFINGVNYASQQ